MSRRKVLGSGVVVGVVAALALPALPALAFDDLGEYLRKADGASYSGRKVVVTVWDGESRAGVFDVEQAGDMVRVETSDGEAIVGSGKLRAPDEADSVAIARWSYVPLSDRYTIESPAAVRRLGRMAESIDVFEDGVLRARLIFDATTYAALATEVYTGDGELYRFAALVDFDTTMHRLAGTLADDRSGYQVMLPTDEIDLPAAAGGYVRADTYVGPDDTVHAYYSDGLFSFSLFRLDGPVEDEQFDSATSVRIDGRTYRRMIAPGELWMQWGADSMTFLLVGDLPPDHLDEVLADLPRPGRDGLFNRLWRGLFG